MGRNALGSHWANDLELQELAVLEVLAFLDKYSMTQPSQATTSELVCANKGLLLYPT